MKQEEKAAVSRPGDHRRAVILVVLIGCVSLFTDMTYEGGRSIAAPFLGTLGASAVVISVVAGLGEFLGYGVRYFSGRAAPLIAFTRLQLTRAALAKVGLPVS